MTQVFSNNVDTTLASSLTDVATSATLTDGSGLNTPTGARFELLTISAGGNFEIVRMTARSGNTVTIQRAQEGTTARAWAAGVRVFAGITAGTMTPLLANASTQSDSVAIRGTASAGDTVALGVGSAASASAATAIGSYAGASGVGSIAHGASAQAYSARSFAFGFGAQADGDGAFAFGQSAYAGGVQSIAFGDGAEVTFGSHGGLALGATEVETQYTFQVGALPAVSRNNNAYTEANAAWRMSSAASVIMSQPLNLKTLQTHTIPLPTGVTFFPEEVGVIITAASGVTGQPTLRFGITGTEAKFLAATATTGLDAVHERERFATLLSSDGAKTLRSEVTVAATGTTLTGRVYWRGFAVVDS